MSRYNGDDGAKPDIFNDEPLSELTTKEESFLEDDTTTKVFKPQEESSIEQPSRLRGTVVIACRKTILWLVLGILLWITLVGWDMWDASRNLNVDSNNNDPEAITIHEALVDVRHAGPSVNADITLQALPQPRWSTVTVDRATCALPWGRVHIDFAKQQHGDINYHLTATCPTTTDIESFAAYLWDVWVVQPSNTTTMTPTPREFAATCDIRLQIRLGRIVPIRYTHTVNWKQENQQDKTDNGDKEDEDSQHGGQARTSLQQDEQERQQEPNQPATNGGSGENNSDKENAESNEKKQDNDGTETVGDVVVEVSQKAIDQEEAKKKHNRDKNIRSPPRVVVSELGPNRMQLSVLLSFTAPKAIAAVYVLVPAIKVQAISANSTEALQLVLEETTAMVVSQRTAENGQAADELVFTLSCNNSAIGVPCPWYRPVSNTLFAGGSITTISVTVDAQDSFLQTVLGDNHVWTVERSTESSLSTLPFGLDEQVHYEQRRLARTLQDIPPAPALQEAAASCLQMQDSAVPNLNVAMCLLVNASDSRLGKIITVANMTFYKSSLAGVGIFNWTRDGRQLDLDIRALVDEIGISRNPRVDVTGDVRLDYWSSDTAINLKMVNRGAWWPFEAVLQADGTAFDSTLDMTLRDATFNVEGEAYLTGATGGLLVDLNDFLVKASLHDPHWEITANTEVLEDVWVPLRENQYAPLPTPPPTRSPTPTPTSTPTFTPNSTQTFWFWSVEVDLLQDFSWIGSVTLEDEMLEAFVSTTIVFYQDYYDLIEATPTGIEISNFDLRIDYEYFSFNWDGSTSIWFSPDVVFAASRGSSEELAGELLGAPFLLEGSKQQYVTLLRNAHPGFANLTDIAAPYVWDLHDYSGDFDYGDDFYDSDIPENATNINALQGSSTGIHDGEVVWESAWLGEVWSYDYYSSTYNDTFSIWKDMTHSYLVLEFTETVEDIFLAATAVDLYHYADYYIFNYTTSTSDYGTTEDYERIVIEEFTFRWGSSDIIDLTGEVKYDLVEQTINVFAENDARTDFAGNVSIVWLSDEDSGGDAVSLTSFTVTNIDGDDVYLDLQTGPIGTVLDDGRVGMFQVVSTPDSDLELMVAIGYTWEDVGDVLLASFDRVMMAWNDNYWFDVSGEVTLDLDMENIDMTLSDTTVNPFLTNIAASWFYESNRDWEIALDKILLEVDSTLELDSNISFRFCSTEGGTGLCAMDGNPFGVITMESEPSANMQMEMGLNFTWNNEEEFLKVVMDHCRVIWKYIVYVGSAM